MKCREFENKIYRYEELTGKEKAVMEDHQSRCAACNSLAEQVIQSQRLVKKVSALKAEAQNPHQLTQRIMNSISTHKHDNIFDKLTSYMDNLFVRYSFSAVSFLLIALLLYQQQEFNDSDPISKFAKTEIKKGPVLNMSGFLNNYYAQRSGKEPPIARYTYYKAVGSTFNK
jgi:hypothetical protein